SLEPTVAKQGGAVGGLQCCDDCGRRRREQVSLGGVLEEERLHAMHLCHTADLLPVGGGERRASSLQRRQRLRRKRSAPAAPEKPLREARRLLDLPGWWIRSPAENLHRVPFASLRTVAQSSPCMS